MMLFARIITEVDHSHALGSYFRYYTESVRRVMYDITYFNFITKCVHDTSFVGNDVFIVDQFNIKVPGRDDFGRLYFDPTTYISGRSING